MPSIRPEERIAHLMSTLPDYWWSVDPGDRNVGISWWHKSVCFHSFHTDPNECVDLLVAEAHNGLEFVVYEAFNLRGYQMGMQQGSEFLTSQLIGAIRHICRRAGIGTASHRPSDHKVIYKKPEFKTPERPKNEWRSYGEGPHAKDSECLGEYHVRTVILKGRGY